MRNRHGTGESVDSRRRNLLAALVAAGGLAGCESGGGRVMLRRAVPRAAESPFPEGIAFYQEHYENWTREYSVPDMRTCAPSTPADVLRVVNWAQENGLKLRARGQRHNWSPLTVSAETTAQTPMLLVDTTQHLKDVEITSYAGLPAVRAQTGVLIEDLLSEIEPAGYGFTASTAVGAVTLGGVLAINGHGAAIPTPGEPPLPGQTFGSMSNRILAATAVVWDEAQQTYVLREFDRREPEMSALLVPLGRCFLTEVVLALEPLQYLRCVSHVDIPATELFGAPGGGGRDIESFLNSAGRIESIWYAFTERPWLKVWSPSPEKPLSSREVNSPYNYPFSDNIPDAVVDLATQIVTGQPEVAPLLGLTMYGVTAAGLLATLSQDIWGTAGNTQLFVKPTTLRVHEMSWALLTRRDNVQQAIHDHASEFSRRLAAEQAAGNYPVNMPVEYRVTGVDAPGDMGLVGAQKSALSALRPRNDHPEWDTVIWMSILSIPGTPGMHRFFRSFEQWMLNHYDTPNGQLHPEWSKGWAYSDTAAWADPEVLKETIPAIYRRDDGPGWDEARETLNRLDPHRLFSNAFLDGLI